MRVALFITCLADGVVPEVAKATVKLLHRLGVDVEVPLQQTCCGQMHMNTGYPREALPLVRDHARAFEAYDYVVSPSGSCAASVRHQHADIARLGGDEKLALAASGIASRTWTACSPRVRLLLPKPGRLFWTTVPGRADGLSPSSPTTTWSSYASRRSCGPSRTRLRRWTRVDR